MQGWSRQASPAGVSRRWERSRIGASIVAALLVAAIARDAAAQSCGASGAGNCCLPNPTPFCNDEACCSQVCATDPFCCFIEWDELCAFIATSCVSCGGSPCGGAGAGSCCKSSVTAGCSDATCCEAICEVDPFCCGVAWDLGCAAAAVQACDTCAEPTCPADLDGSGVVGGADLAILLGDWGSCPPPKSPCLGDLNGDGAVNGADLALLLGAWGNCPR
jgi:hypothetical protein